MSNCYLALGANLGPVAETFHRAIESLAANDEIRVIRVSSIYRTAPVGAHAGVEFHNAACHVRTEISPLELLDRMQSVENQLGRTRDVHWGPRTLDLDLIFYGDQVIRFPRLDVPHPAAWYRRFVLDPLHEIAADVVHPEKRLTVAQLRQRLLIRPLPFSVVGGLSGERERLLSVLRSKFPDSVDFLPWPMVTNFQTPRSDPVILAWLGRGDADGDPATNFETLPLAPRLNASDLGAQTADFLTDVLHAALGE